MLYLLLTADSFRESALEELEEAAKYRIIGEQHNLLLADMTVKDPKALDDAKFIYSYFPLYAKGKIDMKRYIKSIYAGISRLRLGKRVATRLECFDVNCKKGYSAKDMEVKLGGLMEKDGYNIDLKNPQVLAYCVLMDGKYYWGRVTLAEHAHGFLDPFRYNKEKSISRAEFKIIEAFRDFKIPIPKVAIDIGAAPGGWSFFLAKNGAAVVAIDSGRLEYEKIRSAGVTVTEIGMPGIGFVGQADLKPKSIMHFKCGLDKAAANLKKVRANFVGNDINVGGRESSKAVIKYSRFMEKDAVLMMTVKCMHRNVDRYMKEVEMVLGPKFRIMRWKVLPHNRQEITLFAKKR